jgi:hypothetical protein
MGLKDTQIDLQGKAQRSYTLADKRNVIIDDDPGQKSLAQGPETAVGFDLRSPSLIIGEFLVACNLIPPEQHHRRRGSGRACHRWGFPMLDQPRINLTHRETLKQTVRQDADIILIGEFRDLFPAETAIPAALTCHKIHWPSLAAPQSR